MTTRQKQAAYGGGSSRSGSEECDFSQTGDGEEVSIGIDLPQSGNDVSSGNVTPVPTTGELDECVGTPIDSRRSSTPLKSLLKNKSFDIASDDESDMAAVGDKKSVRFSTEISLDQVEDFKICHITREPGATIDV